MLDEVKVTCPYCDQKFTLLVDSSAGSQEYVEDCVVCCRPITIRTYVSNELELQHIELLREGD